MPKHQPPPSRVHRLMTGASAGCTAFLLGALALGMLLVAVSLRGA